jgi:hypothetical protein
MAPIEPQISEPGKRPAPRTDEEINAITQIAGERIWIRNARDSGDHYFVESIFKHHDKYPLEVIATTFALVIQTHRKFRDEFLTVELLDRVNAISNDLYAVIREDTCGPWFPDEFKKLVRYFTDAPEEWDTAIALIRLRKINKYDELMRLLEGTKGGTAPALIDGTL